MFLSGSFTLFGRVAGVHIVSTYNRSGVVFKDQEKNYRYGLNVEAYVLWHPRHQCSETPYCPVPETSNGGDDGAADINRRPYQHCQNAPTPTALLPDIHIFRYPAHEGAITPSGAPILLSTPYNASALSYKRASNGEPCSALAPS